MISPNALPDCFCWLQEAKQTQGLSALIRVTAFNSYQKLIKNHKLIKIQPQNPNQTSASKAWPNLSLKVLTKDIQNTKYKIYKIYKNISWPNFSFNIVNTIKVQNLYQTSTSKSRPNCRHHVPQHQHQQHKKTSKSFELVSSKARVTSVKCTKQKWVS